MENADTSDCSSDIAGQIVNTTLGDATINLFSVKDPGSEGATDHLTKYLTHQMWIGMLAIVDYMSNGSTVGCQLFVNFVAEAIRQRMPI